MTRTLPERTDARLAGECRTLSIVDAPGNQLTGADPGVEIGEGHMASAEREPIMGVWGLCPQRGPGAEPLVRGSEGQGAKPP